MAVNNATIDKTERWYFTKEQLENTPSRKAGYEAFKELSYRQQAANFIQDMGQRLKVSQLCINTAIVYMHRFYVFHSFTNFPWHQMSAAALFLAAKVEEQPRKLEYVIRIANICRNPKDTSIDVSSERYLAQSQDLVFNENVLLQTLGFDVAIDHPHTHVVRCCHLVRASKDLAQTSYFMASNSLHLTTMCLQYKPTVVACFCIHVACKWSNWEIPLSNEDKEWFSYVDPTVTAELLQQLTKEFLVIFESCPSRLKEKIMAIADNTISHNPNPAINSPFDTDPRKIVSQDQKDSHGHRGQHDLKFGENDPPKYRSVRPHDTSSTSSQQQREREYRDKKERERLAMQHGSKPPVPGSQSSSKPILPHGHHRAPIDPKMKVHSRNLAAAPFLSSRAEPRDILRDAAKDSPFGIASKEVKDRDYKDPNMRNERDLQKRDYLLKPNVTELNSLNNYSDARVVHSDRLRVDSNRPIRPGDSSKLQYKHDSVRRHDESKAYLKSETDNIKKHLNSVQDKSSVYLMKSSNSTSQKIKSPFNADTSKSVPKFTNSQPTVKTHQQNGNNSANVYRIPPIDNVKTKLEQPLKEPHLNKEELHFREEPSVKDEIHLRDDLHQKQEHRFRDEKHSLKNESCAKEEGVYSIKEDKVDVYQQPFAKRQSLFSPEKSPSPKSSYLKTEVKSQNRKVLEMSSASAVPLILSPVESPSSERHARTYSSSSEPELRPVMKKIDQVEGFENLMRDATIGIDKFNRNSDIIDSRERREQSDPYTGELLPPNTNLTLSGGSDSGIGSQGVINGLETNPTLISNLLKQAPAVHAPSGGVVTSVTSVSGVPASDIVQPVTKEKDKEHHHHKSKKKNKEKHKHKDKEKNREEKEKKKKHKDKDREKHKHKDKHEASSEPVIAEPIKIKIHKDKIQPVQPVQPETLKIRIPKDKIKTEGIGMPSYPAMPSGGLKLKIPKDVINNCTVADSNPGSSSNSSKKRERDRSSSDEAPPSKMAKAAYKESKQNGRHSYNKVRTEPNQDNMRPLPRFPPSSNRMPPPRHMFRAPPYPINLHPAGVVPLRQPQPPRNPLFMYPPPNRLPLPLPAHALPTVNIPDMSVPPPNLLFHETPVFTQYLPPPYMFPNSSIYDQNKHFMTTNQSNPPLPTDAPPETPPPPPPPE